MSDSMRLALREHALAIFQAGIKAANPYQAVQDCLTVTANHLRIRLDLSDAIKIRQGRWSTIYLIAIGKAAIAMAEAAQQALPKQWLSSKNIVVTNYENYAEIGGLSVIAAGHPLPDYAGLAAAYSIAEIANYAQAAELVLVLISGGGSALIPYPAKGISLAEKVTTTQLLLESGADIKQINCVRKHLSKLKGGSLAKMSYPADVHALILSDVIGDDVSAIASGPTVADDTSYADAISVLKQKAIWHLTPTSVRKVLEAGRLGDLPETPKPANPIFQHNAYTMVGSNTMSVAACVKAAQQFGYQTEIYSNQLCGEARLVAEKLVLAFKQRLQAGIDEPCALIAGGETTVTVTGAGQGGRNQEMALAFMLAAKKYALPDGWVFLSASTDGRDGPTDAAGGLVDFNSIARLESANVNPVDYLEQNDSYTLLRKSADLVQTGATGTNVADLQVLLFNPH